MEKINIGELLKNCPTGMELDCAICDNVYFDEVTPNMIKCFIKNNVYNTIYFHHDGTYLPNLNAKCVIFPKGKTTWEGFQRPFKDGDVAVTEKGHIHLLRTKDSSYCAYRGDWQGLPKFDSTITTGVKVIRFATEEEKQKLFDAIKENGYRWNSETKTLNELIKPKFKVGDRVKQVSAHTVGRVVKVDDKGYYIDYPKVEGVCFISFILEKDYELLPNKFDITTLKPFESKVLVRSSMDSLWKPAVFGFRNGYNDNAFFTVGGSCWKQCIPYLNNEHLCGTTNDCDDYYKTWE